MPRKAKDIVELTQKELEIIGLVILNTDVLKVLEQIILYYSLSALSSLTYREGIQSREMP